MYEKYERIRDAKGYTNYQVAKETGISQSVLSGWKTGKSRPGLGNMKQIASFLGVTVDDLINE